MRPDASVPILLLVVSLAAGCQRDSAPSSSHCDGADSVDQDGDGACRGTDCDDGDPARAPGLQDVIGDGVDQDCDGSDEPTSSLRQIAAGRYSSDLYGAKLGWKVACGPDRGGDGVGDLAATASAFEDHNFSFAAALPGPVPGEHPVDDVLDLRVDPGLSTGFFDMVGLVGHEHGGGLLLENDMFDDGVRQMSYAASFVTQSGTLDENTPTFGYPLDLVGDLNWQYWPRPYAGPADLTGDGMFDFALGPVVLEAVPDGLVDLSTAGRLALEPAEEPGSWAGAENAIGDLNDDGQDDLLFSSGVPPVWLVFGPVGDTPAARDGPRAAQFWPEEAEFATAHSLDAEIGDVSGDGIDDLVIANMWYGVEPGTWPAYTGIGAVHVWFGPLEAGRHTTATADVRFVGELAGSWTGRGLALGDFDGDGVQSLVIGAPASWLGVPGLVYVFDDPLVAGELTASDAVVIYRGEEPNANTGFSVATCDTDRDGRDELVIGAPYVDHPGEVWDAGVFYWLDEVP